MENKTPKNRYNGGAAPDPGKSAGKPDALKLLETAMEKRAGDIAQTATDMFRFMSMASAMLPNMELAVADPFRRAFNWYDGRIGENPQDAVERRETREEMLADMTEKQREVFILYYRDCMTQDEIAEMLGIAKMSVNERLRYALAKAKKFFCDPLQIASPTTVYERP